MVGVLGCGDESGGASSSLDGGSEAEPSEPSEPPNGAGGSAEEPEPTDASGGEGPLPQPNGGGGDDAMPEPDDEPEPNDEPEPGSGGADDGVAGGSGTPQGGRGNEGSGGSMSPGGNAGTGGAGTGGAGSGNGGGPNIEPPPSSGALALLLDADAAVTDEVVSLGVPFPPGALDDASLLRVIDGSGAEVAAYSVGLASWPLDGSVRSALVAFRATLDSGSSDTWTIEYGALRTLDAGELAANPDGPVAATLEPSWYASSRVIGFGVPASANSAFPDWETGTEDYLADMDPPWDSYGLSCDSTSAERSYYDGPHALYQRFVHRGGAAAYRRARLEAAWYRGNELTWYDGDEVAVYSCADWDVESPLDWGSVRRMLGQGMLDDYLLTGDPIARAALAGLGEAFLRNLPALTSGNEVTVLVTERNMAWPMMGLASYYAIDPRPDVRDGLEQLVDLTIQWQEAGTSGAFEHDIVRPDPEECGDGPAGASPFMTSLLVDGLMDSHFLLGDERILDVVVRVAEWYRDDAITSDGVAFQYLWGCNDVDYDDSSTADLNLLISHVFGAAHFASGDESWLDFGDVMAEHGVENLYAGAPKQFSQSTRTFIKYMGYRALTRTP
jgi:hypothetical protein